MRNALVALLFLMSSGTLWAQQAGQFGGGGILGSPIGGTVKYWLNGTQAIDLGVGAGDEGSAVLYGDLLWHAWDIVPQPKQGKLGFYMGFGPRLALENDEEGEFAIRGIGGLAYWVPAHPIEVFLEGGPVFQLTPTTEVDADIGAGVRFYFGGGTVARR